MKLFLNVSRRFQPVLIRSLFTVIGAGFVQANTVYTFTQIDIPKALNTYPEAISSSFIPVNFPGASNTELTGMNDSGQVTGNFVV